SKATGCKWRINGNLPKDSSIISFTTVVDEHNHQMIPSPLINIAKYHKLGEDMIEFIEFCVQHGTTGIQNIGQLLKGKFPGRNIHQKNLYNAIQIAKKKLLLRTEFDASDLMKFLYSKQTDDPCWFIETKFDGIERRLLKEIQNVLDKESEFARVEEYKDQIPAVGLATIPKKYFSSIEKVVSEYLMPAMVFLVCKQMQECFYYDCSKVDITTMDFMIQKESNDYNEGMREDNYEVVKIHLADIISTIGLEQILEIWRLVISCGTKSHYIILLEDGSHRCTCNLLITHGYPCRHFYKILRSSTHAKWHIGLIASRWYKDDIIDRNINIWQQLPITLCVNSDQEQGNDQFKFDYMKQIRGGEFYNQNLREINSTRRKYGKAYGLMRKAIDIAIATNSYDEFIGICHGFITDKQENLESDLNMEGIEFNVKNPIVTARKGRPAGRAKSSVEIQEQRARK
ncbi:8390_t:CDS:2, partial [Funneliformis caledonium]